MGPNKPIPIKNIDAMHAVFGDGAKVLLYSLGSHRDVAYINLKDMSDEKIIAKIKEVEEKEEFTGWVNGDGLIKRYKMMDYIKKL